MQTSQQPLLSVVVPVYNESTGIAQFHASLTAVLDKDFKGQYEVLYCNDGSHDTTHSELGKLSEITKITRVLSLSINFGNELAKQAGIHHTTGK